MSSTLYLIGNGFDKANELPTSYNDFRNYLKTKYGRNQEKSTYRFFPIKKKNMLAPNDYQNVELMIAMIDSSLSRVYGEKQDWRHFEDILGKLKYEDLWKEKNRNELNGIISHVAFTRLRDYFREWILDVDVEKAKPIEDFPQDREALYLSFNYTLTLEKIYHILPDNVCHIHGVSGDKELIFGHKGNRFEYMKDESMAERQIVIVREMLQKDTEAYYIEHQDFFNKIDKKIKEIVSIGFSYSDVDMYYIEKIIKKVGMNTTWYIHMYNAEEVLEFKHKLRKSGFYGKIRMFKNIGCYKNCIK